MKKIRLDLADKEREIRSKKLNKFVYIAVMISFIIPIAFLIVMLCVGGIGDYATSDVGYHSAADYTLMLVQCVLGVAVMHIPSILSKKFKFELPTKLYTLYIVFLYCAIFLGEVRSFYYLVPNWDTILHAMSSMMAGFFGLMSVYILNRDEHIVVRMSPFFISLFAFFFSVTIGTLWEIYEFAFDGILGLNMQKIISDTGEYLVGRTALSDTMKDIIVDTLGALTASIIGYLSIKHEKNWFVPELKDDSESPKKDS